MRQRLGDLLGVHDSSVPAVDGERTVLLRSGAVKVRLRRSARARRMRLVLLPGIGPELVVPESAWLAANPSPSAS
jgi:hypothetical protein